MTWQPEIWHNASFSGYLHCVKISAIYTSSRFGVIRKKVKT